MGNLWKAIVGAALFVCIVFASGCREDFEFAPSTGSLNFSKDTVFLDTVFANIGSSTYQLKVYNTLNSDISIPFIGLDGGENSSYRLNVDGLPGKTFRDIPLLAQDSLFVFIEITAPTPSEGNTEFLNTDFIAFGEGVNTQRIPLVTLVKDAIFLYPTTQSDGTQETLPIGLDEEGNEIRISGFYLTDEELNFTNEKPYVIYGYAAVEEGKTLQMAPGTRVHFHNDSGILVEAGGNLQINGAVSEDTELLENEVVFEGDRLEPDFENESGQWGAIWFREGSVGNQIKNLTLKNATIGLLVEGDPENTNSTLTLQESQILNSSQENLYARAARILARNSVFGGANGVSVFLESGGAYQFKHCTLANYAPRRMRSNPTLVISNESLIQTDGLVNALEEASFVNCIIDGSLSQELQLMENPSAAFTFRFDHVALKFPENGFENEPLYDFNNSLRYNQILQNVELEFVSPGTNEFDIQENSPAIDAGFFENLNPILFDILERNRTTLPDLGAYEFVGEN
ncbi:MAG: hypothetical protein AAFQ20_08785 [Bacteroidota bacterium]